MCSRHAHTQDGWEQQTLRVAAQLLDVRGLFVYVLCCTFAAVVDELISSNRADTGAPTHESQRMSP